jgi:hypothetical protein
VKTLSDTPLKSDRGLNLWCQLQQTVSYEGEPLEFGAAARTPPDMFERGPALAASENPERQLGQTVLKHLIMSLGLVICH